MNERLCKGARTDRNFGLCLSQVKGSDKIISMILCLQGLHYLHANKIAHGDLKPDNFLLATNGHIKIADFGSSQLTRVGDLVNRTAGTPAFMAPEMCNGSAYQARVADVWSLGISLYMFVFGE